MTHMLLIRRKIWTIHGIIQVSIPQVPPWPTESDLARLSTGGYKTSNNVKCFRDSFLNKNKDIESRFGWEKHLSTSTIWRGPTDIKSVINVNSDECYMSQCPYKLINHILEQIFDIWKTAILRPVSNNINSNQQPLKELRMCEIWQIVSVDV